MARRHLLVLSSIAALAVACVAAPHAADAQPAFDPLQVGLGDLYRTSSAKTRSISPENPTGEKGRGGMATRGTGEKAARDLGQTWKVSPSVKIQPGQTFTLANIRGPGAIQHIWMTPSHRWRFAILRMYWDGETTPSVEVPVGDFFASAFEGRHFPITSVPIAVNPGSALNSYWVMPFRRSARITIENLNPEEMTLYFQIDYTLAPVPDDAATFHAQFRRSNPLAYKTDHVLLDGVKGQGQYVGTYVVWGPKNSGWWGEGEIKFFMDGDREFPTICGTGTEDYFGGSYNFWHAETKEYTPYTTPYLGLAQVILPRGSVQTQARFGMYRWHIPDPIRFEKDLRVTIQALGWNNYGTYLPLQDDIASTVFWYQKEPHAPFPKLPPRAKLEIN